MPRKEIVSLEIGKPNPNLSAAAKFGSLRLRVRPDRAPSGDRRGWAKDVREQTRYVLERIKAILAAAGTSLDNVLSAVTHLTAGRRCGRLQRGVREVLPHRQTGPDHGDRGRALNFPGSWWRSPSSRASPTGPDGSRRGGRYLLGVHRESAAFGTSRSSASYGCAPTTPWRPTTKVGTPVIPYWRESFQSASTAALKVRCSRTSRAAVDRQADARLHDVEEHRGLRRCRAPPRNTRGTSRRGSASPPG